MISVAEFNFFTKKVASLAYAVYRKLWLNIFRRSILLFVLIKIISLSQRTSQTRENVFYFTSKALFIIEKIKF